MKKQKQIIVIKKKAIKKVLTDPETISIIYRLLKRKAEKRQVKKPANIIIDRFIKLSCNAGKGDFLTASQILHSINKIEPVDINEMQLGRALSQTKCFRTVKNGIKHYCIKKIKVN